MHESPNNMHESPDTRIVFLGGNAYASAKGKDFPPHKHSAWELVYYRSGHIRCRVGAVEYAGVPGLLLLTRPNTVHAEIASTAYSNYFVQCTVSADPAWPVAIHDDQSLGLLPLFAAITRELNSTQPYRSDLLAHLAAHLEIVLQRARLHTTVTPAESLIMRAEGLMEDRFRQPLRVNDIAAEIGCSTSTLRSYFSTYRNTTPCAHLQSIRLRNAVAFLVNSTLTLCTIAEQCGFDSASHLSRRVKQATGLSPGQLRSARGL